MSLQNIWQITLGRPDEPNLLYCGVEPAALFESRDAGETWSLVRGLFDHPHRPRWMPSNGGLALHSIVLDPQNAQRIYVAISSGGVYRTDDAGRSWTARNRGIRATFMPDKYPEFGQCVHKIVMHPSHPGRLFLQNHWGLYRSDDSAENWIDIANGVPSDFGFAIVIHPRNPDWVYVVPVESDEFRCACDGRLRVYRTRNAGASWDPLLRGLPQKQAYETVLRDAMTTDSCDPRESILEPAADNSLALATTEKPGIRSLMACLQSPACGVPSSRTLPTSPQHRFRHLARAPHLQNQRPCTSRVPKPRRDDCGINLSHSGRIARVHRRTHHGLSQLHRWNSLGGLVGALQPLSRGPRPRPHRAGTDSTAH